MKVSKVERNETARIQMVQDQVGWMTEGQRVGRIYEYPEPLRVTEGGLLPTHSILVFRETPLNWDNLISLKAL